MPESYQIGDVILLKPPPTGEPSEVGDKLFVAGMNYLDCIRDSSYTSNPPVSSERLLFVVEVFTGPYYRVRGFPLTRRTENSKTGFLENIIRLETIEEPVEYIAVPISVNAKDKWIEKKVTQIPLELAKEIVERKYTFVIGKDPRDQ